MWISFFDRILTTFKGLIISSLALSVALFYPHLPFLCHSSPLYFLSRLVCACLFIHLPHYSTFLYHPSFLSTFFSFLSLPPFSVFHLISPLIIFNMVSLSTASSLSFLCCPHPFFYLTPYPFNLSSLVISSPSQYHYYYLFPFHPPILFSYLFFLSVFCSILAVPKLLCIPPSWTLRLPGIS